MCRATFHKTPISVSTLDKNPMPGHLFECNIVDEVTTRRGTDILIGNKRNLSGAAKLFVHFSVHFLIISFLCSLINYLWNIAFCLAPSRMYTLAPGPDLQGNFHQVSNCEAQVISEENSS